MVFSISFCSTDFGEKSFFIKWKCTPILEKVKKKLWRATIDCFTETEIGILLSKMLHKSVKYFFTWNQHTFLNNHINYNPSLYLSKNKIWDLFSRAKNKYYMLSTYSKLTFFAASQKVFSLEIKIFCMSFSTSLVETNKIPKVISYLLPRMLQSNLAF